MTDVVLSLGSNLGDRSLYMRCMEEELQKILCPPLAVSGLLETEPLGTAAGSPWFFNRLLRGMFAGTPRDLLNICQSIEYALGRTRPQKNAPRTADIDILLFGNEIINENGLIVPHPRILERRFCLCGLKEIAGDMRLPGSTGTIAELAAAWEKPVAGQVVRAAGDEKSR